MATISNKMAAKIQNRLQKTVIGHNFGSKSPRKAFLQFLGIKIYVFKGVECNKLHYKSVNKTEKQL